MKKCPKCGARMGDKAMFCSSCGASMAEEVSASVEEQVKDESVPEAAEDTSKQVSANEQFQEEPNSSDGQFRQEQYRQSPPPGQYRPQYQPYDPKDHTSEFDPADIADNKLFAAIPYFLGMIGVIAALLVQDSPYTKFHVKNEIRFLIAAMLACIPMLVPVLGWILSGLAFVVIAALKILAVIQVLQGKAKEIPIIGSISFLR